MMRTNDVEELSLEELETVSGGFWDGIKFFGARLWDMCKDFFKKLQGRG